MKVESYSRGDGAIVGRLGGDFRTMGEVLER